jgi:1,4-dihydroxy-2-naphthoate octaprenyltransferase
MNEGKTPLSGGMVTVLFFGIIIVLGAYMVHTLNVGVRMGEYIR